MTLTQATELAKRRARKNGRDYYVVYTGDDDFETPYDVASVEAMELFYAGEDRNIVAVFGPDGELD